MNSAIFKIRERLKQAGSGVWAIAGVAAVFTCLMDAFLWSGSSIGAVVARFLVAFFVSTALLLLMSAHRWLLFTSLVVMCALGGAAEYFFVMFGEPINENTLGLLFEATPDELRSHAGAQMWLFVLASVLLGWGLYRWTRARIEPLPKYTRTTTVLCSIVLAAALPWPWPRPVHHSVFPLNILTSTLVYWRESRWVSQLLASRRDLGKEPASVSDHDVTTIVVIGETVRADHLQLNGYARATTPKLAERGVISFGNLWSCEANTRYAVPCMLTRATPANMQLANEETSFVSVLRSAGFDTWWISNQGRFWTSSLVQREATISTITAIASEAEHVDFLNRSGDVDNQVIRDEALLPGLSRALTMQSGNKLVVLHMAGSHWRYDVRYPQAFEQFTPVCAKENPHACSQQSVINAYDNSLLYMDHVLSQVIDQVAARKAIVIFMGDHGEGLGEDGIYAHHCGSQRAQERVTGAFIWTSPSYRAAYPERVAAIESHRTEHLSHDNLFHTAIDCSGVESSVVNRALSLCR